MSQLPIDQAIANLQLEEEQAAQAAAQRLGLRYVKLSGYPILPAILVYQVLHVLRKEIWKTTI